MVFDENGRKSFEEVEPPDGAVTLPAAREVRLLYIVLVVCFLFIIFWVLYIALVVCFLFITIYVLCFVLVLCFLFIIFCVLHTLFVVSFIIIIFVFLYIFLCFCVFVCNLFVVLYIWLIYGITPRGGLWKTYYLFLIVYDVEGVIVNRACTITLQ